MLDRTGEVDGTGVGAARTALRDALRRARAEVAERTDAVVDLRHAEIARLELLREELEPIFAQVPPEVDIFDVGLAPGERPRLFVDMVSFVEMGRDKRAYRFMRDGRHGRAVIAESALTGPIAEAVTTYVARRLVERELLLADEDRIASLEGRQAAPAVASASGSAREPRPGPVADPPPNAAVAPRRRGGWVMRAMTIAAAFLVGGALGAVVVVVMITAVAKGYLPV